MPGRAGRGSGGGLWADAGRGHPAAGQRGGGQAGRWATKAHGLHFSPLLKIQEGEGGVSWACPEGIVALADRLCWAGRRGSSSDALASQALPRGPRCPFGSCPGRLPSLWLRPPACA